MKKPTQSQITTQSGALLKLKPSVRHYSGFGDNHWDAIDAQCWVLNNNASDDRIFARYGEDESAEDGDENFSQSVLDAALDARRWLDGDLADSPDLLSEWQELVVT